MLLFANKLKEGKLKIKGGENEEKIISGVGVE